MKSIYVIGSLRNDNIPKVSAKIRELGIEVFDDWYGAGPEADDHWKALEVSKGHDYKQALAGRAAQNVYHFDKANLDRTDAAVLILPAGRSGHLELGYTIGRGKPGYILIDDPERWDVMYNFATKVFLSEKEMLDHFKLPLPDLRGYHPGKTLQYNPIAVWNPNPWFNT